MDEVKKITGRQLFDIGISDAGDRFVRKKKGKREKRKQEKEKNQNQNYSIF